jgi:hypothetical protein
MKILAVLLYILILYGSLMTGMYIKFSDTAEIMRKWKYDNDK